MSLVWGIVLYVAGIMAVWVIPALNDVDLHMIGYVAMSVGALVIVCALIKPVGSRPAARRSLRSSPHDDKIRRLHDA